MSDENILQPGTGDGGQAATTGRSFWQVDKITASVPLLMLAIIAMDFRSDSPLFVLGLAVMGALVMYVFMVSPSRIIYPLILLLLAGQDNLQSSTQQALNGVVIVPSLWIIKLGPINPSMVVIGLIIVALVRLPVQRAGKQERLLAAYFTLLGVISVLYGNFTSPISAWISDIRLPLFLIAGCILIRSYLRAYPDNLQALCRFIIAVWLARFAVDVLYLISGFQMIDFGGVNRVSLDSGKPLITLFFALAVLLAAVYRKWVFAAMLAVLSLTLTAVYMSRTIWVGTALTSIAILALLCWLRRLNTRFAVLIAVALIGIPLALNAFNSNILGVAGARFSDVYNNPLTADPVRPLTSINALHKLIVTKSLVWGMGYGSWYTDDYMPFPSSLRGTKYLADAFSDEEWNSGKFTRLHVMFVHVLFKYGLIGLGLLLYIWLKPVRALLRITARLRLGAPHVDSSLGYYAPVIAFTYLAFAPSGMINLGWSGKSAFICAILAMIADRVAVMEDTGD